MRHYFHPLKIKKEDDLKTRSVGLARRHASDNMRVGRSPRWDLVRIFCSSLRARWSHPSPPGELGWTLITDYLRASSVHTEHWLLISRSCIHAHRWVRARARARARDITWPHSDQNTVFHCFHLLVIDILWLVLKWKTMFCCVFFFFFLHFSSHKIFLIEPATCQSCHMSGGEESWSF